MSPVKFYWFGWNLMAPREVQVWGKYRVDFMNNVLLIEGKSKSLLFQKRILIIVFPDHDGGRPMEVNACILTTHMVYL
jgi:hypothetical protein